MSGFRQACRWAGIKRISVGLLAIDFFEAEAYGNRTHPPEY
jgi:hypothetical protein